MTYGGAPIQKLASRDFLGSGPKNHCRARSSGIAICRAAFSMTYGGWPDHGPSPGQVSVPINKGVSADLAGLAMVKAPVLMVDAQGSGFDSRPSNVNAAVTTTASPSFPRGPILRISAPVLRRSSHGKQAPTGRL